MARLQRLPPELVKAIQLHLSGKSEDALAELKRGSLPRKSLPEIYPASVRSISS